MHFKFLTSIKEIYVGVPEECIPEDLLIIHSIIKSIKMGQFFTFVLKITY